MSIRQRGGLTAVTLAVVAVLAALAAAAARPQTGGGNPRAVTAADYARAERFMAACSRR